MADIKPPPARSDMGRWVQLSVGLFAYGAAVPLMIQSGLGLGPWDAFHVGLNQLTGISVGMASILVGVVIVAGSYILGIRPGAGTLANMVLIGVFIDLTLPLIPPAGGWAIGLVYYACGIVMVGLATGMYIAAGLGIGPRDGLMVGISATRGWPVRRVRTGIEIAALAGGWAMGAAIGPGTVLFAATVGASTQLGLQLFGVLPPTRTPPTMLVTAPTRPRWRWRRVA
ncbi:MAG: membrane protein [Gemmatimonadota bacterium]